MTVFIDLQNGSRIQFWKIKKGSPFMGTQKPVACYVTESSKKESGYNRG